MRGEPHGRGKVLSVQGSEAWPQWQLLSCCCAGTQSRWDVRCLGEAPPGSVFSRERPGRAIPHCHPNFCAPRAAFGTAQGVGMCEQDGDRSQRRLAKGLMVAALSRESPAQAPGWCKVCLHGRAGRTRSSFGSVQGCGGWMSPAVLLSGIASSWAQGEAGRKTGNFSFHVPFVFFFDFPHASNSRNRTDASLSSFPENCHCTDV